MQHHTRAFAVLTMALPLVAGCSGATKSQRVTEAPSPPSPIAPAPTVATAPPAGTSAAGLNPIPGHPPVTTTGVVASVDPATGTVTFRDGRTVKLTDQSKVLQPVNPREVRPGAEVVVRNALPVGVRSASVAPGSGKRQRMATVASIDEPNQTVKLMDGTSIKVTPSTNMHMGTAGASVVLTELRPGDELVIIVADEGAATSGGTTGAMTGREPSPSALPRQEGASTVPTEPSELMVFRHQAP
jgi:hypothetical protein